jgi:hypothetical protein
MVTRTTLEELPLDSSIFIIGLVSWAMMESSTAGSFYNVKFDIFRSLNLNVKSTSNTDCYTGATKLAKII